MREIKFRAWSPTFQSMHYENFTIDCLSGKLAWTSVVRLLADAEKLIIMQFSGIRDKNGKEIYNGEVLKASDISETIVVGYKNGMFGYEYHRAFHSLAVLLLDNDWVSIGNIYENPELVIK